MVELRKRAPRPAPEAKSKVTKPAAKAKASKAKPAKAPAAKASSGKIAVGDVINLADFGGEVHTQDGTATSLAKLVEASKAGVVLFTYPAASTPGCTTQARLFRDDHSSLTSTGLDIYGLSNDSLKANTNFKVKQNLPYALLCDPKTSLIAAIGLKKDPSGTRRGVFVVNKSGKVLLAEPGSPASTVDAVKALVS